MTGCWPRPSVCPHGLVVLVDASVWIDHLRRGNRSLASYLEHGEIESHPLIVGELACGTLRRRDEILSLLSSLPRVVDADHDEVLTLVDAKRLNGCGLGWVDVHLLASAVLSGTTLWTRDKRLAGQAKKLALLFEPTS